MMKAVVIPRFGGPEVLEVREVPVPQPKAGEVLIEVAYAGVNYSDLMGRSRGGTYARELPYTPGYEVAGVIQALGEGVEGLQIGQRVAAMSIFGGYAEFAVAQAALTFPLDSFANAIEMEQAAAFPMVAITAYDLLTRAGRICEGESVLIHSAAGGVGTVAGQIARALGARLVLGVVSKAEKVAEARSFGYDQVFPVADFEQKVLEATHGKGIDIVLDASGEPIRSRNLPLLARFGRLVVFGNASGNPEKALAPGELLRLNCSVVGYSVSALMKTSPHVVAETAQQVIRLIAESKLKPVISEVLPLEQAAEAHRRIEARSHVGKLLLCVK
ncbi:quinone oxidoreductase family protein [Dictyobacter arantiisoli]|uniref:NADPH:quinone reductase n=1 Tax=Dictyobacter arantiisoli TaxID=2014874 RepID=A0A5A5TFI5_9CHLR|nr:zinc-binding dehydrogenase [Dictyobacter arantiisoli]GCF09823.1 NADPH:quinone reductase [Dictyobacter arantiisoli]